MTKTYRMGERDLTLQQWLDEPDVQALGLTKNALYGRLNSDNWSIEAALTTPNGAPNPTPRKGTKRPATTTAKAPATKPAAKAAAVAKPSTKAAAKAPATSAPGPDAVLDAIDAQWEWHAAQMSALEEASNKLATSYGVPTRYED